MGQFRGSMIFRHSSCWRLFPCAVLLCFTGLAAGENSSQPVPRVTVLKTDYIADPAGGRVQSARLLGLDHGAGVSIVENTLSNVIQSSATDNQLSRSTYRVSLPELAASADNHGVQNESLTDSLRRRAEDNIRDRIDGLRTPTGVISAIQTGKSSDGLTNMVAEVGTDMTQAVIDHATTQIEQQALQYRLFRSFSLSWSPSYGRGRESTLQADTVLSLHDGGNSSVFLQAGLQSRDGEMGANSGFVARTTYGNKWLIGVNVFYDYLNSPHVNRWSAGMDLKSSWLDLAFNLYKGNRTERSDDGFEYYSPDGWDVDISGRAPSLPWLSYSANYYYWNAIGDGSEGVDLRGLNLELTAHPVPLLSVGLLYDIAESSDNDFGVQLQMQYDPSRTLSEQLQYNNVSTSGNIAQRRFDRVRREYQQRVLRRRLVTGVRMGDVSVSEAAGTATLTVMLAQALTTDLALTATTSDGTATAGADYTALSSRAVSISAGQTSATFTVAITADTTVEGNENFTVSLAFTTTRTDVEFDRGTATVTILDDDTAGISLGGISGNIGVTAVEPAMGATAPATLIISLTAALNDVLTVTLNSRDGTATGLGRGDNSASRQVVTLNNGDGIATAGMDYAVVNQRVTIAAGDTSATVEVTILGDDVVEEREVFTVFATASALSLSADLSATAIVTITDDDMSELSIANQTVTEVDAGNNMLTLTLTHALAAPLDVTVNTGTDSETATVDATAGSDYTALADHIVTIPANTVSPVSHQFPITVANDDEVEGNEVFTVTIAATADRLTLGTSTATVTITDDDISELTIADVTVNEDAGNAELTVTISRALTVALMFMVDTEIHSDSGTVDATPGADYIAQVNTMASIAAGATSTIVQVPVIPDTVAEGNEVFLVRVKVAPMDGLRVDDDEAIVTIEDDDAATLSLATTEVDEVAGTAQLTFSLAPAGVTLPANLDITVAVAGSSTTRAGTAGGTPTISTDNATNEDFTLAATSVTLTTDQSSVMLGITLGNDDIVEGPENIELTITANALPGLTVTSPGTVRINDDDMSTLQVRGAPLTVTEGDDLTVTVELTRALSTEFVASISTADSAPLSAVSGTDYSALNQSMLTFAAGVTEQTVTFTSTEDMVIEGTETLALVLAAVTNPVGLMVDPDPVVVSITDDDPATLALSTVTVAEDVAGGTMTMVLQLSPATASLPEALAVMVQSSSGTAIEGTDYTGFSETVTIPATAGASGTFAMTFTNDAIAEGDEDFTLAFSAASAPDSLTITTPATVTITDDDGSTLRISKALTVTEGDTLTVTVELSNALATEFVASISTVDSAPLSAVTGTDYTALNQTTLTFAAGVTEQTVTFTSTEDTLTEGPETLGLVLAEVTNPLPPGLTVDTTATVVTIEDDDAATLSLTTAEVDEAAGATQLTFSLAPASVTLPDNLDITVAVAGSSTARAGTAGGAPAISIDNAVNEDFTLATTSVTLMAGDDSVTLGITLGNDDIAEGPENIELTITTSAPGLTVTSPGTVRIIDDDMSTLQVRGAPLTVTEGDALTVTVELTIALATEFVASISTVDSAPLSAVSGTDYSVLDQSMLTFAAGVTEQTVTFTSTEDMVIESTETLGLMLAAVTGTLPPGLTVDPAPAVVSIMDDDAATLALSTATVAEDVAGGAMTMVLQLSPATASLPEALAVMVQSSSGTAIEGADYTGFSEMVTIPDTAGASGTFAMTFTNDAIAEGDENFTLAFSAASAPDSLTITTPATVTITDDDGSTLRIRGAPLTVTEGDTLTVTVELSNALSTEFVASISTADSATLSAVSGTDYSALNQSMLTFPAGTQTQTVTFTSTEDMLTEGPETLGLVLAGVTNPLPPGLTVNATATVVTIEDDDAATLSLTTSEVDEAAGTTQLTFSLAPPDKTLPDNLDITVAVAASSTARAGTAAATPSISPNNAVNEDFTLAATSVTLMAGQGSVMLDITLGNDDIAEGPENIELTITASAPDLTVTSPGTVRINDNDSSTLQVRGAPLMVTEGDDLTVTVELTNALATEFVASISTADSDPVVSAISGTDYSAISTMLTFAVGVTEQTVTLTSTEDMVIESTETLGLVLVAVTSTLPSGLTVASDPAVVSIEDDDAATLALSTVRVAEDVGTMTMVLQLSPATASLPEALAVMVQSSSGTAIESTDYTGFSEMVTIPVTAGASGSFAMTFANDDIAEGDEDFMLAFSAASAPDSLTITTPATVTIMDDDGSTLRISGAPLTVTEGDTLTVTVELSNALATEFVASISTEDSATVSAVSGTDYTALNRSMLTFPAGTQTQTVTFTSTEDMLTEGSETLGLMLEAVTNPLPPGVMVNTTATVVTIEDDDAATLSLDAAEVDEIAGTTQLTFSLTPAGLTLPDNLDITVAVGGSSTARDGATGGAPAISTNNAANEDFTLAATSLTLIAGQGSVMLDITLGNDDIAEGPENIELTITASAPGLMVTSPGTVRINDDDRSTLQVQGAPLMVTEGDDLTVTVELTNALATEFVASISTEDSDPVVSAISGTDYSALNQSMLTFPIGTLTRTVTFESTEDMVIESTETLGLVLAAVTNPLPVGLSLTVDPDPAVVSITDDDAARLELSTVTVAEDVAGGTMTMVLQLSPATASLPEALAVMVQSSSGTAIEGTDYTAFNETVTIPASIAGASGTFDMTFTNDDIAEGDENFMLAFSAASAPDSLTITTPATVTIMDDDGSTLRISGAPLTVTEGDNLTVTVELSNALATEFVASISTADSATVSAISGTDYTAINQSMLTFPAGIQTQTVTFTSTDDTLTEGPETLGLVLAAVTNPLPPGLTVNATATVVTIEDNDDATLSLTTAEVDEAAGTTQLTFSLAPAVTLPDNLVIGVMVDAGSSTARAGTAAATPAISTNNAVNEDFTLAATSVTLLAGQGSVMLDITLGNDDIAEGPENIELTITASAPDLTVTSPGIVRINDDDHSTLQVRGAPLTVTEGDDLTVTVELTNTLATEFVASISTADSDPVVSAISGTDYSALNRSTLTFAAGVTEQTVTFISTEDMVIESTETLGLVLAAVTSSLPAGLTIDPAPAVVSIIDDDAATLALSTVTVAEDVAGGTMMMVLQLSPDTASLPEALSVMVQSSSGTAIEGTDYTAFSEMVTIPASIAGASGTFAMTFTNDDIAEGDENFTLAFSAASAPDSLTITTPATVTIMDDDGSTLRIRKAGSLTVTEGDDLRVTVELSNALATEFVASISTADSATVSAVSDTDYTALNQMLTFAAGVTEQTVTFTSTEDTLTEGSETLGLVLAAVTNPLPPGLTVDATATVVNIEDDDAATLSLTTAEVDEIAGTTQLTFSLAPAGLTLPDNLVIGVMVDTVSSTARAGTAAATPAISIDNAANEDFTLAATSVTLTAGQGSVMLDITLGNDDIVEGPENIELTITASAPGLTVTSPGTVRINDNDSSTLRVQGAPLTVTEGDNLTVTVELTNTLATEFVASISTEDSDPVVSAISGTDYSALNRTMLTFPVGTLTRTVIFSSTEDMVIESTETLGLMLVAVTGTLPAGLTVDPDPAVVSIEDDDAARLELSTVTVAEDVAGGTMTMVLQLSPATASLPEALAVMVQSSSGTAIEGTDYTAFSEIVTIPAGTAGASGTFDMTFTNDDIAEGDENFTLAFSAASAPDSLTITTPATVTIMDDDGSTLRISGAPLTVTEGDTLTVTVELSKALATEFMASISTEDSATVSAVSDTDYTAINQTMLTFPAGTQTQTVTFTSTDDTLTEGPETLGLVLEAVTDPLPPGVMVNTTATVVTIEDDDAATLSLDTAEVDEIAGATQLTFSLTAGLTLPDNLDITLAVAGSSTARAGTAGGAPTISIDNAANEDFTLATTSVTLMAGDDSFVLGITLGNDDIAEGPEDISLTITASAPGLTVPSPGTVRINDDDRSTLQVRGAPLMLTEGDDLTVTVELTNTLATEFVASISTADSATVSAVSGTDYSALTQSMLTFPVGTLTRTVIFSSTEDMVIESTETLALMLAAETNPLPPGLTVDSAPVVVSITDDDAATLALSTVRVAEDVGTMTMVLQLTPNTASLPEALAVMVQSSSGTAIEGTDYTGFSGMVSIPVTAGASGSFAMTFTNDDIAEGDEDFTLAFSAASAPDSLTITTPATVTIMDDDGSTLRIRGAPLTVTEGDALTVTVELSNALATDFMASISTEDSATVSAVSGTDYSAINQSMLTFPAGTQTQTVTFTSIEDMVVEGSETLGLVLAAVTNPLPPGLMVNATAAVVTIEDDDTATLRVQGAPLMVTEGDDLTVTVRLSKALATEFVARISTADSAPESARSDTDYTALNQSMLTFAVGVTEQTVTFSSTEDRIAESTETLALVLAAVTNPLPPGLMVDSAPAVVSITDDDPATLALSTVTVAEDVAGGTMMMVLQLSPDTVMLPDALAVMVQSSSGTAIEGTDYTAFSEIVTIPANMAGASGTFAMTFTNDDIVEGDEDFMLALSAASAPDSLTITTPATVTITDEDTSTLSVQGAPLTFGEDGGNQNITLSLTKVFSSDLMVRVQTVDGTAMAGADYDALDEVVTIPANTMNGTASLEITSDDLVEGLENLQLQLTVMNQPSTLTVTSPATVNITDADAATLSLAPAMVDETAGTAQLTFSLVPAGVTLPDNLDITVAVAGSSTARDGTTGGTPTISMDNAANEDFTLAATSVALTAGQGSVMLGITLGDDDIAEGPENIVLNITASAPGLTVPSPGTVRINDNEVVTLVVGDAMVDESMGIVTAPISLTGGVLGVPLQLTASTANGTAISGTNPGQDYTAVADQMIMFNAGSASPVTPLEITLNDDDVVEPTSETFTVNVTVTDPGLPAGVFISTDTTGTITITDEDSSILTLSLASGPSVGESSGTTAMSLALTDPVASELQVTVATADGTGGMNATVGTDYMAIIGTMVTIPALQTSVTVPGGFVVLSDDIVEDDEGLVLTLTDPGVARLTVTSPVAVTIDDDDMSILSVQGDPLTFGEDDGTQNITLSLTNVFSSDLMVRVQTVDGTAMAVDDYTALDLMVTIPANTMNQAVFFGLISDNLVEGPENLQLQLTVMNQPSTLTVTSPATVNITDADAVTLSVATLALDETVTGNAAQIRLELNQSISLAANLDITLMVDGSSTATAGTAGSPPGTGEDFTLSATSVTLRQGQSAVDIPVTLNNDNIVEGPEDIILNIVASAPNLTVTTPGTVRINDDDRSILRVQGAPLMVTEGDNLTVTVELTNPLATEFVAGISTEDSAPLSAIFGTDYGALNRTTLTFPIGTQTQTVTFSSTEDMVIESTETLGLMLAAVNSNLPPGLTVDPAPAVVSITDDDAATLELSTVAVAEDVGTMTMVLELSPATASLPEALAVMVQSSNGTAVEGSDYTGFSGMVTIPANIAGASGSFAMTFTNDDIAEGDENFMLALSAASAPDSLTITTPATVTIMDNDDSTLRIRGAPLTVTEGDALTVTVELSSALATDFMASISTADSATVSAVSDTDYTALNQMLTFPAGTLTQTVTFTSTEDMLTEGPETLGLVLAARTNPLPPNLTVNATATVVTIEDDDAATLSLDTAEVDEIAGTAQLTFSLAPAGLTLPADLNITLAVAGSSTAMAGTAGGTPTISTNNAANEDFTLATTSVTLMAGDDSFVVDITLGNDDIVEGPENIELTITASAPGLTVTSPGTVRINDDDGSTLQVRGAPFMVTEGDDLTVTVELTNALATEFVASISTADSAPESAISGTDYTALNRSMLTFAVGVTEQTVTFSSTEDRIAESTETLALVLAAETNPNPVPPGLMVDPAPAVVSITDDDPATLALSTVTVAEDVAGGTMRMVLQLSPPAASLPEALAVMVQSSSGTAIEGTDYTGFSEMVTIPANIAGARGTFDMTFTNDDIVEGDENFMLAFSAASAPDSLTITTPATVTIADEDISILSVQGAPFTFGEDGVTGPNTDNNQTITLSLTKVFSIPLIVQVRTVDGTAMAGDDYTALDRMVTIPANTMDSRLFFIIRHDDLVEGPENLQLQLTVMNQPSTLTVTSPATVNITDADAVTLSVATLALDETATGNAARIRLELDQNISLAADLDITLMVDGSSTATAGTAGSPPGAGEDFTLSATSVTLPQGQSAVNIPVTLNNDNLAEGPEDIILNIVASAPNLTVTSPGTVRINDDDVVRLVVGDAMVDDESTGTVTAPISLTGGVLSVPLQLTASTADGTAVAGTDPGQDYTAVTSAPIRFNAGSASPVTPLAITLNNDNVVEPTSETFTVNVTVTDPGLPAGVFIGTDTTGTITITDTDSSTLTLSLAGGPSVGESSGTTAMSLALTNPVASQLQVTVATADDADDATVNATAGTDYTAISDTMVAIPALQTSSVTVPGGFVVLSDDIAEGNEGLVLTLADPGVDRLTVTSPVAVTIVDDEMAELSIADATVIEGDGTVNLTITLSSALATDLDLTASTSADSDDATVDATAGVDYTALSDSAITIPAGDTSASVVVTISPDTLIEAAEVFLVTVTVASPPPVFMITDGEAVVTITDDDVGQLILTQGAAPTEAAQGYIYTITLEPAVSGSTPVFLTQDLDIQFTTADITAPPPAEMFNAVAGSDYAAVATTVTIVAPADLANPGTTNPSVTATVNIMDDNMVEGTEQFSASISLTNPPPDITIGTGTVTTQIMDDDSGVIMLNMETEITERDPGQPNPVVTVTALVAGTDMDLAEGSRELVLAREFVATVSLRVEVDINAALPNVDWRVPTSSDVIAVMSNHSRSVRMDFLNSVFGSTTPGTTISVPQTDVTVRIGTGAASGSFGIEIINDEIVEGLLPGGRAATAAIDEPPTMPVSRNRVNNPAARDREYFTAVLDGDDMDVDHLGLIYEKDGSGNQKVTRVNIIDDDTAPVTRIILPEKVFVQEDATELSFDVRIEPPPPVRMRISIDADLQARLSIPESRRAIPNRDYYIGTDTAADLDFLPLRGNGDTLAANDTARFTTDLRSQRGRTITFRIGRADSTDDDIDEPDESLVLVTLGVTSAITGSPFFDNLVPGSDDAIGTYLLAYDTVELVIVDNDAGTMGDATTVSIADVEVNEGAGMAMLNLTLSQAAAAGATFTISTADGAATAGSDYTALTTGTVVTVAAGSATATVSVDITDDTVTEGIETFTVTIDPATVPTGFAIDDGTATVTIIDNENQLTLSHASASEGDDPDADPAAPLADRAANPDRVCVDCNKALVLLSLRQALTFDVMVKLERVHGTATEADYALVNDGSGTDARQVRIAAGETTVSVPVTILYDDYVEGNEQFMIRAPGITRSDNNTVVTDIAIGAPAIVTIVDNDTAVVTLEGLVTVGEDSPADDPANFRVVLDHPVVIPLQLRLTPVSRLNDDGTPDTAVDTTAGNQVAESGLDFNAATFIVNIDPNTTTVDVSLRDNGIVINDDVYEFRADLGREMETFVIAPDADSPFVTPVNGVSVQPGTSITVNIKDDEPNVVLDIMPRGTNGEIVLTGMSATFELFANLPIAEGALNIAYRDDGSGAFTASPAGVVNFVTPTVHTAGITAPRHTFMLTGRANDNIVQPTPNAVLNIVTTRLMEGGTPGVSREISFANGLTEVTPTAELCAGITTADMVDSRCLVRSIPVTVTDGDTAALSITENAVGRRGAGNTATVRFMLSNPVSEPVTVTLSTADGSTGSAAPAAMAGQDYTPISNRQITIPAMTTNFPVEIDILDGVDDTGMASIGAEVFTVSYTATLPAGLAASNITGLNGIATVTINETVATFTASMPSVGNDFTGITGVFTSFALDRPLPAGVSIMVRYSTRAGTAIAFDQGEGDFLAASNSFTFASGQATPVIFVFNEPPRVIIEHFFVDYEAVLMDTTNAVDLSVAGLGTGSIRMVLQRGVGTP